MRKDFNDSNLKSIMDFFEFINKEFNYTISNARFEDLVIFTFGSIENMALAMNDSVKNNLGNLHRDYLPFVYKRFYNVVMHEKTMEDLAISIFGGIQKAIQVYNKTQHGPIQRAKRLHRLHFDATKLASEEKGKYIDKYDASKLADNMDFLEFVDREFKQTITHATLEDLANFAFGSMKEAIDAYKKARGIED